MKILLVDDSKSARYALRLQLQRHGVEVDTADSAESAFELLKGDLPDAILMDHMMPGLNGFEALEVIREDPRTAHLPVVMCTSHEDADFAATAQRKGVLGILPKSGAPEKLPAILEQLRDSIQVPHLTAGPAMTPVDASPRQVSRAPQAPTATPPASSGPAAERGVDEAQILARLEARVAGRTTGLLDDLRRDLSERLTAEIHRQIDMRLETERRALEERLQESRRGIDAHLESQRRSLEGQLDGSIQDRLATLAQSSQAELQALAERLGKESLPRLVKVEIEAERGQILALVEHYLRELGPRPQEAARPDTEEHGAADAAIVARAAEIARLEARSAVDAALSRRPPTPPADQAPARGMTGLYLAILAAALAGVGAAAAVYVLLS